MGYVGLLVGDEVEANTQLFRLAGNLAFDNGKPNCCKLATQLECQRAETEWFVLQI